MKTLLALFIFISINLAYTQDRSVEKISIIKSNNSIVTDNYKSLLLANDILENPDYLKLKEYLDSNLKVGSKEPECFVEIMDWVSARWKHNGWNAAPDSISTYQILINASQGSEYRCVEYGRVLADILQLFGYPSRTINLRNENVAYGGAGMGHVATEVWSSTLKKWIFLDPQFNVSAQFDNQFLNIYDLYNHKKSNELNKVKFKVKDSINEDYFTFIEKYLGYIAIKQVKDSVNYMLCLKLEGKEDFLTFQSFPYGRTVFTNNVDDLYYTLNKAQVIINFAESEIARSNQEYSNCNITSEAMFIEHQAKFAAKPVFELAYLHSMPWHDTYQLIVNGENYPPYDEFTLKKGNNIIQVTPVNLQGILGLTTEIEIIYQ